MVVVIVKNCCGSSKVLRFESSQFALPALFISLCKTELVPKLLGTFSMCIHTRNHLHTFTKVWTFCVKIGFFSGLNSDANSSGLVELKSDHVSLMNPLGISYDSCLALYKTEIKDLGQNCDPRQVNGKTPLAFNGSRVSSMALCLIFHSQRQTANRV